MIQFLYASSYPSFSNSELSYIQKHYGKTAISRITDYSNTIDSFKKYSKNKQLLKVNFYLNQLLPQYDNFTKKQEDYWATPKEFLSLGYGDCEDYAIIKYYTLLKLGFDKDKLFLTTVHEKYKGGYHMVLSYFRDKDTSPFVLDNLSFRVLTLQKRVDLEADMFINESGVFKLINNHLQKIGSTTIKFNNLLKKINR